MANVGHNINKNQNNPKIPTDEPNIMKLAMLVKIYPTIVNNINQASKVLNKIGLPAIIRPAFTLGGLGGGIAKNKKDYLKIIKLSLIHI